MVDGTRTRDLPNVSSILTDLVGDEDIGGGTLRTAKQSVSSFLGPLQLQVASIQDSQVAGAVAYDTRANLNANLNYVAHTPAIVYADSTPANNGSYVKVGASGTGSWTQISTNTLSSVAAAEATNAAAIAAIPASLPMVQIPDAGEKVGDSGHAYEIVDADGRVLIAFDGDGNLVSSHNLVQRIQDLLGLNKAQQAVYDLPMLATAFTYTDWNGLVVMGQSNASGNNNTPTTTTQPFNNKRISGGTWSPLVESGQETCLTACASHAKWRVLKDMKPWNTWSLLYDWVGQNRGGGGATYDNIRKGSTTGTSFSDGITNVTSSKTLAIAASKTYAERAILFLHGESDATNGITRAAYLADIIQLKNDWNTDVIAVTGQANRIPMFIAQVAVGDGLTANNATCLAMEDAAVTDSEIYVIVPGYALNMDNSSGGGDGLHYGAYDQRLIGEYFGKALHRYYIEKRNPSTVRLLSQAIIDPHTVEMKFYVPVPPLMFDVDTVIPIDSGLGFALWNGSTYVAITKARVVASDTVRIYSDTTITAGFKLNYAADVINSYGNRRGISAGNHTGGRGCLRDSDYTRCYYPDQSGVFRTLPNWLASFSRTL
jgi:hypothetical protein